MKTRALITIIAFMSLAVAAQAQEWSRYIPKNQRKDIFKKVVKAGGLGLAMTHQYVGVFWVTESFARVIISEAIDRERLTNEEAEARYKQLRPEGGFCFLIEARRTRESPFGTKASSLGDPLATKELFLQRADDRKKFSKGEVSDHKFDIELGGIVRLPALESSYVIIFPRSDRAGEPLVKDMTDKMEIQFTLAGKKVVLDYKVKDFVTRLEEL
jgi:hypothetical protein